MIKKKINKGWFKKGHKPIKGFKKGHTLNIGEKNPMFGKHFSEEHKRKISLSNKGKKRHSKEFKEKMRKTKIDDGNPNWKGDEVGKEALHNWVQYRLGKPDICEFCGKINLKGRQIHWANIGHTYKRNLTDWIRLCSSCHKNYDADNKR